MTTQLLDGLWDLTPHAPLPPRTAPVPEAWQHTYPDTPGVDVLTYSTRTRLDPLKPGERLWLRFEAVATAIDVAINDQPIGSHIGDWVPFQFEIPASLGSDLTIRATVDRLRPGPVREVNGHPQQSGHITKGFHDVLSAQHAGIWDSVSIIRTRSLCTRPNGLWIRTDRNAVHITCELADTRHPGGSMHVQILDAASRPVAQGQATIAPAAPDAALTLTIENPSLWSPEGPTLYTAVVTLRDTQDSQTIRERFGFRRVHVSPDGRQILLNDQPLFISGILDWGHEPNHISPSPTEAELRERFGSLRAMGFNCVCICMWYPPRRFYELADEYGMLIWQEHPVWKSDMSDARIDEYKAQFAEFFRRDRNHASVAIVSGACEHEEFNPTLATWWWAEAQRQLSDRLIQIQTAFLAWTDLGKTDLYDEHTYEGSGRWVYYLRDLDAALEARPRKPIVMGESVLGVGWPDVARFDTLDPRPWWMPPALDLARDIETRINALDGEGAARGLVAVGDRTNLALRKFQTELFRMNPQRVGMVANSIRDVAICPCGFLDDFGRWRFDLDDVRAFMGDAVLLLRTPDFRSGFCGGHTVRAEIGLSNFSPRPIAGNIELTITGPTETKLSIPIKAPQGHSPFIAFDLALPAVERPTPLLVRATIEAISNTWTLWVVPEVGTPEAVRVVRDAPHTQAELAFGFEERKYSSGWGLEVQTWTPRTPDPCALLPTAPAFDVTATTDVIVTHRLTPAILESLAAGARVLHLPSNAVGSLPTIFFTGFGQVPWIRPVGPLARFGREWIEDLLEYDLMRRWTRAVCTSQLGIADHVEPYIRMLYTHDMNTHIKELDILSATRVGKGVLAICCADLFDDPGRTLLSETVRWLGSRTAQQMRTELDVTLLASKLLTSPPAS